MAAACGSQIAMDPGEKYTYLGGSLVPPGSGSTSPARSPSATPCGSAEQIQTRGQPMAAGSAWVAVHRASTSARVWMAIGLEM